MKLKYKAKYGEISTPVFVLSIIFIVIGYLVLSFLGFTFGYFLITLLLEGFFNFILPFSLWYALGAWLIFIICQLFITTGIKFFVKE